MKGARLGALGLLLLVLVVTGCSKQPGALLAPEGASPSKARGTLALTAHVIPAVGAPDSIAVPFGAGMDLRVQVLTSTGADTSSSTWTYYWSANTDVIFLLNTVRLGDPSNFFYLEGTNDNLTRYVPITVYVVQTGTTNDTLATATLKVTLKRAPPRDVTAFVWIYHITRSLGGSISANSDSARAWFTNNDADNTLLRAGNVTIGGTAMIENHTPTGQNYSGSLLFKIPSVFEVSTTGPERDPRSQVMGSVLDLPGPQNELVLTYPNNRDQVSKNIDLDLQWSGGMGDAVRFARSPGTEVLNGPGCASSPDSVCVEVVLSLRLTDSAGHTFQIQTLDNGRFTVARNQMSELAPGLVEAVLRRELVYPTVVLRGSSSRLETNAHIVEENHSSFFLK
ncbi:MAG: hypothetical protein HZB25_03480 [Candidatus Eisenbacteria bacterium]|nr:hypothetical protein [Candidatus Eisenbacteria bacterium]